MTKPKKEFVSKYIYLCDASKEFTNPEDIISALKEESITASGIYFCPDDEEAGITQSLEPTKISVDDWSNSSDLKLDKNSVTVRIECLGNSHVFFYNDIKLNKEEFEQYVRGNQKATSAKNKPAYKQIRQHNHIYHIEAAYSDYQQEFKKSPTNRELWDYIVQERHIFNFDDHHTSYKDTKKEALIHTVQGVPKPLYYDRFMDIAADIRKRRKNEKKENV